MVRIYTSPVFYRHDTGVGHPETADRLDYALEGVRRAGPLEVIDDIRPHIETDRIIAKVHSAEYSEELAAACRQGFRLFHSLDNPISASSYGAARLAVGLTLAAVEDIWDLNEGKRAFVIARPPGHHAEREEAMGFCFFNTVACAAEALVERRRRIERVFILDWDVHHGNGTQHLFEERSDVFYASIHRYPFYPGTGAAGEIGTGAGAGFTKNIPLDEGAGDAEFLGALEDQILPAIDDFRPQAILVSAGFDAHRRDPLGGMRVTEQAFGEMTRRIVEAAEKHCNGRLLTLLEGGYDPEGIASSVAEHVVALG